MTADIAGMSIIWKIVATHALRGIALLGLVAAAPESNDFLKQPIVADATVTSPQQPNGRAVASLGNFTPAPVPDVDHDAPVAEAPGDDTTHVSPKLFHNRTQYHGEGFVFGSTVQDQQERKLGPTPGVNLIMPLQ